MCSVWKPIELFHEKVVVDILSDGVGVKKKNGKNTIKGYHFTIMPSDIWILFC